MFTEGEEERPGQEENGKADSCLAGTQMQLSGFFFPPLSPPPPTAPEWHTMMPLTHSHLNISGMLEKEAADAAQATGASQKLHLWLSALEDPMHIYAALREQFAPPPLDGKLASWQTYCARGAGGGGVSRDDCTLSIRVDGCPRRTEYARVGYND